MVDAMPVREIDGGWLLEGQTSAYVVGVESGGVIVPRYWGARLPWPEDYPPVPPRYEWSSFEPALHLLAQEYPAAGGLRYADPCLKVQFADGVRDLDLVFREGHVTDGEQPGLAITLADRYYPLRLILHYRLHADLDLIERWVTVLNDGDAPVLLERIYSAQWHVPPDQSYTLSHLAGRWSGEFQLIREPLTRGLKVLESRRLTTSHAHTPWFALDAGATEETGAVWFGTLAWSGNWQITAEVIESGATRLAIGVNDWDFAWRLDPGASFASPRALAGWTSGGYGGASRRLHAYVRQHLLPHGAATHAVLYNSWEVTEFAVDAASQLRLAAEAAALGAELFVMDDGWFQGRNSSHAGLGDWRPDPAKFPHGLSGLIAGVKGLGMAFGLWIEPEMVNPDSDLFRAHPDWVIHFPTRPRSQARNQLILNLARTDVQDHLIAVLDALLRENAIDFIKWDMNRNVSEPGWPDTADEPRSIWVRYVQGLYRVWETLRTRHPHVIWQACSGGGGRADYGILRLADQIWTSDNTSATARLAIQEGFSQLFPAATMESWVTDVDAGRLSLTFRFHVSMCGVLGLGANLLRWTGSDKELAKDLVAHYKRIRHLVHQGAQYRLRSSRESAFSAVQYVNADRAESVVFAFRTHLPEPAILPSLHVQGLDEAALYELEGRGERRSGLAWREVGVTVRLRDFESALLRLKRVEL
jgi:alpha-galactosidase